MGPRWLVLAALLRLAEQKYSLPYTPDELDTCKDPSTEYYEETIKKCCSKCHPGYHMDQICSTTLDTQCKRCGVNTYTEIWNRAPRCFGCSPACKNGTGLVQTRECTPTQDRACTCSANMYCSTKLHQKSCKHCKRHKKCQKGYGVSKPGTDTKDTICTPCPPGSFSDEESYTAPCRPHTVCKFVSIPGSFTSDTVCSDLPIGDLSTTIKAISPHTIVPATYQSPGQSLNFRTSDIKTRPVQQNIPLDVPQIGLMVGVTSLVFVAIAVAFFCFAFRKKGQICSHAVGDTNLPFSTEKQSDKKQRSLGVQGSSSSGQEEQHLLHTSGSSSSSLDNPTGSAKICTNNNKKVEKKDTHQKNLPSEGCKHHDEDRHNSASSEHSGNGGTQVNVTCIVKVCNSDHSSQFLDQMSSNTMDHENISNCTPTGETIPLSKEENPLKRETEIQLSVEAEDNLLQDLTFPEEKPFPLGIQDVGMKSG
ncbi:tumor necrosis factor receptor superfamily member 1B [Alligator mississippiensis]|uniref:tumor necrosis factor receptor superfamily member 1B n=1 Tax=Alligator mississippiensis TaxID=8496 RepID=UPI0028772B6A|nr:tumor necrosis factor receptor superfamily member 1B [Alligator mississippiensis]